MMKKFSLEPGTVLRLANRSFAVEQAQGNSVVLRDLKSQELESKKLSQLYKAYADGELRFADLLDGLEPEGTPLPDGVEKQLSDFLPRQREQALLKFEFLRAICPTGRLNVSRCDLPDAIHGVWSRLPQVGRGSRPPSVSTFYEWRRSWQRSTYSVKGLINRFDLRGRRPAPLDERLVPIVGRQVDAYYASSARLPISEVVRLINAAIQRHNIDQKPAGQLPEVSPRQIVREIERGDRFEILKRRYGVARARTATRVFGERTKEQRPLQRVEIDHTPLDVLCISDDLQTIRGRAFATVVIDAATRMILAIYISFREPSADTVLRALKQAILPKEGLLKELGIKGEWPAWGVMETVYVDNGMEFHSKALELALQDMGVTVVYCPPRQPFMKGTVERFLKKLNYGFVHQLPGTTFAKFGQREDYKSEDFAVLTLQELRRLVTRWVVEVYSKEWHRGIQTCPLEMWKRLIEPGTQCLPQRVEVLDVLLTHTTERSLTGKGIEYATLHYTCPELEALRSSYGSMRLVVRPNHDDLGTVQVLNPNTQEYFTAHCTRPDYANGLTLEQHKYLNKRAHEEYASLPHERALLAAKLEIREELDTLVAQRQKDAAARARKVATKRGAKRSGRDRQAKTEFALQHQKEDQGATVEAAAVDVVSADWSFDRVKSFPTGQGSLI
jgi:putative transposase